MNVLIPFFVILLAGLIFSELSHQLHLPWVVLLIAAGIIVGPGGLNLFHTDPALDFLGDVGLIFLMFMAGLETRLSTFKEYGKNILVVAILNGVIPFLVGYTVMTYFGYGFRNAALIGIVFVSSSIAVVVPALEKYGVVNLKLGKIIVASTIINDALSLVLLSLLIQTQSQVSRLPLPIFYLLLAATLFSLRWAIPRVRKSFRHARGKDFFEQELRVIITILIGTVVIFGLLGLHPITAGFFAGLVLSESIERKKVLEKLHAFGYGLFIPAFFIIAGSKSNPGIFIKNSEAILISGVIVFASVVSKLFSGYVAGIVNGFTNKESWFLGFATVPQLSTSLAAVFAGFELGFIDQTVTAAMVVLSIVTTFVSPLVINKLAPAIRE